MKNKKKLIVWNGLLDEELKSIYESGASYEQMANHFGVTRNSIYNRIYKLKETHSLEIRKGWNEKKDNELKNNIKTMSFKELSVLLNKREEAVRKRAKFLNIHDTVKRGPNTLWTEKDYTTLEAGWGILTLKRLAKTLNRTESAILIKGKKEKLGGLYKNDFNLTIVDICSSLNVQKRKVHDWFDAGLKHRRKRLNKRYSYFVEVDDLKLFLKKNPDKWSGYNIDVDVFGPPEYWFEKKVKEDTLLKRKPRTIKPWTTTEIDTFIDLLNSKKSIKECAVIFDRTLNSVIEKKRWLKKNNML